VTVGARHLSRRSFLGAGAAGVAAIGAGCGSDESTETEDARVPVAVVAGDDVEASVRRAIELAGGLGAIRPGDTVFIKPNAVHGSVGGLPGIVTSVEVLSAVIRAVRDMSPGHVIVGDRSARIFESEFVFNASGLGEAALSAGADEVYPAPKPTDAPDDWVLLQPPAFEETWSAAGGILAMRKIVEADFFLDLPVCKNHRWAGFSLSMKNLIGATGDSSRDALHFNEGDPDRLSRDIAILNQMFTPGLCVLDARTALINGGPEGVLGDRVQTSPGLIAASRDRIALDAFGAALLQLELSRTDVPTPDEMHAILTSGVGPWGLPQIVHGIERGLGVSSAEAVRLRFEDVADAEVLESRYRG
jgi:uncharacterized protein (DUF362 family)